MKSTQAEFGNEQASIMCYRGDLPDPQWLDQDPCKLFPRIPVLK